MDNNKKKLIVIGAGVDRSKGIDFPLANTLLGEIALFLKEEEGQKIDKALREMLPNLRFSFSRTVKDSIDKITKRDVYEQKAIVDKINKAIRNLDKDSVTYKHGKLIVSLFNKLASVAEQSQLDKETEDLIKEVFPNNADDLIDSDSILDINKLSLSDTFKSILKVTLNQGLNGKPNEVSKILSADMLNIELLLIEKFLGFYSNKITDIKSYIYISWVLWAFLVYKQRQVYLSYKKGNLPFYSTLNTNFRAITLNYTSFIEKVLGKDNVIYFHGGLNEYVRMDTRNLLSIQEDDFDLTTFINEIIAKNTNVDSLDFNKQKHTIPSLVPPLKLKPILSHKYIELWSEASTWIKEAEHIVIVGYSFNNADEHFNDILRNLSDNKKIDIIVPEAGEDTFKQRIEKVFKTPASQFDRILIQGIPSYQANKIRLIPSIATNIDIDGL